MAGSISFLVSVALAALASFAPPAFAHHGTEHLLAGPAEASDATPTTSHAGQVTELFVDHQVLKLTIRYVGLRTDDGHSLRLKGSGIGALSAGWRVEASGQLEASTLFVSATRVLDMRALAAATGAKAARVVEGRYTIIHVDDFEQGQSRYDHAVFGDD